MSVVRLEGDCLGGGSGCVEIRKAERFALFLYDGYRNPVSIEYGIDSMRVGDHVVSVGQKCRVRVVEHLFSALYAMKLFCVRIDVHGEEIPFFDGSSSEFVRALRELPSDDLSGIRTTRRIEIDHGSSSISYTPVPADELVVEMYLKHPYIGEEQMILNINADSYRKEIAPARTFVFTTEDDPRLRNIPPYGVGITEKGIYSETPLRFENEPVRHKIQDLLGDLHVIGRPLRGKIRGENTSHSLNLAFARILISTMKECNG